MDQTKLIDCGSTVFVYDYYSPTNIKQFEFEFDIFTNLKRLITTNFVNDNFLATFSFKAPNTCEEFLKSKFKCFINKLKKSSGQSKIKYLAIWSSPKGIKEYIDVYLITDIQIYSVTEALDEEILDEDTEEYFDGIWGDEVYIDIYSDSNLLNIINSYEFNGYIPIFQGNLKKPKILWNEEAKSFIKDHNLSECPNYKTYEIYDKKAGGIVIVNEYSLSMV